LVSAKKIVSITAYWGSDDAESTIELSAEQWQRIQRGASHVEHGVSWYEGESEGVCWSFQNCTISIDGADGRQCLVDAPISELFVHA
jgi:hypothetical protein